MLRFTFIEKYVQRKIDHWFENNQARFEDMVAKKLQAYVDTTIMTAKHQALKDVGGDIKKFIRSQIGDGEVEQLVKKEVKSALQSNKWPW